MKKGEREREGEGREGEREGEREREREKTTDRQTDRDRQTETDRENVDHSPQNMFYNSSEKQERSSGLMEQRCKNSYGAAWWPFGRPQTSSKPPG